MDKDLEATHIQFYNAANHLFHSMYQDFLGDKKKIDRHGDENVYQLLRSKHRKYLLQSLEQQANSIIASHQTGETQFKLRGDLAAIIRYFEIEFIRRSGEI